jgi:hypothetical protein
MKKQRWSAGRPRPATFDSRKIQQRLSKITEWADSGWLIFTISPYSAILCR